MTERTLILKDISLSEHAYMRTKERLNLSNTSKEHALNAVKSLLSRATYIGEQKCERGEKSYMYTCDGFAIYLGLDMKTVKSIVKITVKGHYTKLEPKIKELYDKELRKKGREERAKNRKMEHLKIKSELEIAQLRYRKFRTRSHNVKIDCENKIRSIEENIKSQEEELSEVQKDIRKLTQVLAVLNQ